MNKLKRLYNKVIRSRKKVSPERIKELNIENSHWIHKDNVNYVGYDENGTLIVSVSKKVDDDDFDAYVDSKLSIIVEAPMKALPVLESDYEMQIERQGYVRPTFGGASISPASAPIAGTLTRIVRDKVTKEWYILSNWHVLTYLGKMNKGEPILQPGIADRGDPNNPKHVIGHLSGWIPLKNGVSVDIAWAKLTDKALARWGVLGLGDSFGTAKPKVGMRVRHSGRTKGNLTGKITAIGATIKLGYGEFGNVILVDQIVANIASGAGDSGSSVQEYATEKWVGVLEGGNGSNSVISVADTVLALSGMEMLPCPNKLIVDKSHHNGFLTKQIIDNMKAHGVVGMWLKCTQGGTGDFFDDTFTKDWALCKQENFPVSPYIFMVFNKSAQDQYNWFKQCFGDRIPDFPPMLDSEDSGNKDPKLITSILQKMSSLMDGFCKSFDLKPPVHYSNSWWNTNVLDWSGWKYYPLQMARWYVDLPWYGLKDTVFPKDWRVAELYASGTVPAAWQFTAEGNFMGQELGFACKHLDISQLLDESLLEHGITPEPPEEPPDEPEPGEYMKAKILVSRPVRTAPTTSAKYVETAFKTDTPEIIEEKVISANEVWWRCGLRQWFASKYKGVIYATKIE